MLGTSKSNGAESNAVGAQDTDMLQGSQLDVLRCTTNSDAQKQQRKDSEAEESVPNEFSAGNSTPDVSSTDSGFNNSSQVTDDTMEYISSLEEENRRLLSELMEMKRLLHLSELDEESFQDKKDLVVFYTGLPYYKILSAAFCSLKEHVGHVRCKNSLPRFREMILFLIRIRLNVPLQDLAYRFNVHQSTASRIVGTWLQVAYVRLKKCITSPAREQLICTMPMVFRRTLGTRVYVILDCFEIFIDRPSSLLARAQTWSSYKHHNTVKYLIGIAPQGVITFISKWWGAEPATNT